MECPGPPKPKIMVRFASDLPKDATKLESNVRMIHSNPIESCNYVQLEEVQHISWQEASMEHSVFRYPPSAVVPDVEVS